MDGTSGLGGAAGAAGPGWVVGADEGDGVCDCSASPAAGGPSTNVTSIGTQTDRRLEIGLRMAVNSLPFGTYLLGRLARGGAHHHMRPATGAIRVAIREVE